MTKINSSKRATGYTLFRPCPSGDSLNTLRMDPVNQKAQKLSRGKYWGGRTALLPEDALIAKKDFL